jgi:hypothetical protein
MTVCSAGAGRTPRGYPRAVFALAQWKLPDAAGHGDFLN